ncbi:hypothetical protein QUA81_24790 [Microcoleus sp. F6_B4]
MTAQLSIVKVVHILVIDDNPTDLLFVKRELERQLSQLQITEMFWRYIIPGSTKTRRIPSGNYRLPTTLDERFRCA